MAWEKRGNGSYFYRSVRSDGKVQKIYYGTGYLGQLAAGVDALRRAEEKVQQEAVQAQREQLDTALSLTRDLSRGCELLAAATLLAAGYHRPGRHPWRRWIHGRKTLELSA